MNRKLRFSNISDVEKELSKLENYKIRRFTRIGLGETSLISHVHVMRSML